MSALKTLWLTAEQLL